MGSQSNHVLVASTVDIAIILAYNPIREKWRKRLAAYFLNPRVSCASHFLSGNSTGVFSATASIGATFHLFLCLPMPPMSVYPFSMVMVPFYIILLPEEAADVVHHLLVHWKLLLLLIATLTLVLSVALQRILDGEPMPLEYPHYGLWPAAVLWNICTWSALAFISIRLPSIPRIALHDGSMTQWSTVLVCLFAAVGLSPYMNIRNYPALAMFSNLRSYGEGRQSNHFLLKEELSIGHVWSNKDSFITIHNTTLPALRYGQVNLANYYLPSILKFNDAYGVKNEFWINPPVWLPAGDDENRPFVEYSIPYIEFQRRVTQGMARKRTYVQDFMIEFSVNGDSDSKRSITIPDGNDSLKLELLSEGPLGIIESMLFRFRSFDIHYSPCRH
eukprot:gene24605-33073_t